MDNFKEGLKSVLSHLYTRKNKFEQEIRFMTNGNFDVDHVIILEKEAQLTELQTIIDYIKSRISSFSNSNYDKGYYNRPDIKRNKCATKKQG